jgi:hypothetical protein
MTFMFAKTVSRLLFVMTLTACPSTPAPKPQEDAAMRHGRVQFGSPSPLSRRGRFFELLVRKEIPGKPAPCQPRAISSDVSIGTREGHQRLIRDLPPGRFIDSRFL